MAVEATSTVEATIVSDATPSAEPSPVPTPTTVETLATASETPATASSPLETPEPDVPDAVATPIAGAGGAYVPPSVTDGPLAFWGALAAVDHHAAAVTATGSLLAAWNAEPLRPEERGARRLDLQAIAGRRGLRYLGTSGTLSRLTILNVPAILELSLPDTGQRRFALLAGTAGSNAILRFGDMGTMLTPDDVDRVWLGDAHLFWRDFENLSPRLLPGSSGTEVGRLQRLLARVGVYPSTPSLTYDTATTEAVARFQRSNRLVPDGIVGPLTKIVLYGSLADYRHPRLSGGT
jgi:general secretion pathway protein A